MRKERYAIVFINFILMLLVSGCMVKNIEKERSYKFSRESEIVWDKTGCLKEIHRQDEFMHFGPSPGDGEEK